MNDGGFVSFFLTTMLKEHFHTKSGMARILGLHLRTVQEAYKNMSSPKGASLVFINSVCYCYNNAISVDAIYAQFKASAEKKGGKTQYPWNELMRSLLQKTAACTTAVLFPIQNFSYSHSGVLRLNYICTR